MKCEPLCDSFPQADHLLYEPFLVSTLLPTLDCASPLSTDDLLYEPSFVSTFPPVLALSSWPALVVVNSSSSTESVTGAATLLREIRLTDIIDSLRL